jgi:hypothetical protein
MDIKLNYEPNPKQQKFHGLGAKYRGFCGGWGNGKTTAGCVETFVTLCEYPGTLSIVARKTRPELKSTTWDMFLRGDDTEGGWHGIPKPCIKQYNKSDLYLELWNGSRIHGLPLDEPKKLENYNLGHFWIDQAEEVEEDIALKFRGRLRQHAGPREGLFTFNPDGHNYLWRWFISQKRSQYLKKTHKCIEASPFDNPNLPEDYLESFQSLPKHWYDRFVMGSHEVFVGQIFPDWDPDVHIIEPFFIPRGWPRFCCIDPGMRHEGAVSWCAQDPIGNVYYYREILTPDQPIAWWATTILDAEEAEDVGGPEEEIEQRLIGPEARQRSQTSGQSVLDLYHECEIYPDIADRDPAARISRITEYLRPSPGHVYPLRGVAPPEQYRQGAPRLYVFATCEKLIEYLPQYRWKPQRSNFTEEDSPEAPRKKDDHNIDNLGHILVAINDLPEVADTPQIPDAEQRMVDEHFRRELEAATEHNPLTQLPHRAMTQEAV